MPIAAGWWEFSEKMIELDKDEPGVYEFGDSSGAVIYVGSSSQLKRRLKEHFHEPWGTCVRLNATKYRIEYTARFKEREQELYDAHVGIFGRPPRCNDARPGAC
jgi:excinuclease UvrABC nuclease subunit